MKAKSSFNLMVITLPSHLKEHSQGESQYFYLILCHALLIKLVLIFLYVYLDSVIFAQKPTPAFNTLNLYRRDKSSLKLLSASH